jgi:acyl dehydratase
VVLARDLASGGAGDSGDVILAELGALRMTRRSVRDVTVGDALPGRTHRVTRADLVRYAGASGDFNPLHWDEATALAAGLPGVIAHGMLTMALAAGVLTDWSGDPGAVVEYGVRFVKPLVVPAGGQGAELQVGATVAEVLPDARVRVDVTATSQGVRLLTAARAVLQLAP